MNITASNGSSKLSNIQLESLNYTIQEEEPTGGCNCTFPNSYVADKTINMSCLCNTTTTSWCANLDFTGTGWWNVTSTVNVSNMSDLAADQIIWIYDTTLINIKG